MSDMQPNSAKAGEITFFSYWLPALAPGKYSVHVTPTLTCRQTDSDNGRHRDLPCGWTAVHADGLGGVFLLSGAGPDRQVLRNACRTSSSTAARSLGAHDRRVGSHRQGHRPRSLSLAGFDPAVRRRLQRGDYGRQRLCTANFRDALAEVLEPTKYADKKPTSNVIGPKFKTDPYDDEPRIPARPSTCRPACSSVVMPRKEDLPYLAHVREVKPTTRKLGRCSRRGSSLSSSATAFPRPRRPRAERRTGALSTRCAWCRSRAGVIAWTTTVRCQQLCVGCWCSAPGASPARDSSDFKSQMNDSMITSAAQQAAAESRRKPEPQGARPRRSTTLTRPCDGLLPRQPLPAQRVTPRLVGIGDRWCPCAYGMSMTYESISCADAALRYNPDKRDV